jgi:uncharacterized protein
MTDSKQTPGPPETAGPIRPVRQLLSLAALLLLALATIGKAQNPAPPTSAESRATGWVIDEAGTLSAGTIESLDSLLASHERQTSNQVVVVVVGSLQGIPLEEASLARATSLRAGQKGRDNGVLLFVARDDRRVRIEVGYGLEGVLPDAVCSRIIREEIVPRFRESDFDGGVTAAVGKILAAIRGEYRSTFVDRARGWVDCLPSLPPLPATVQFVGGIFFWLVSTIWFFVGPTLFSIRKHPVRLGLVPGLPLTAWILFQYPFALLVPVAGAAIALVTTIEAKARKASAGVGCTTISSGRSSGGSFSSSSFSGASSSSGSGSSFSGGGGSFGGGGASGSW